MGDTEKLAEGMEESKLTKRSLRQYFQKTPHIVENWIHSMEEGTPLASVIRPFWKEIIPLVFQLETSENDSLDWQYCEHEPALFQVLEKFMCGGGELQSMLESLSTPPLCGRMFKFGEPTYYCRECGVDCTCVFCANCFKNSVHQHHKYKMSKSPGGGRCDCGDVEAWKSDPFCDIHSQGRKTQEDLKQFPDDIAQRARSLFSVVLAYAFELLTLKYSVSLPSDLKQTDRDRDRDDASLYIEAPYCLVLYNDEAHTFEQVFDAMNKVMKNDHRSLDRDLNDMVTRVDREGRAVIKSSSFQHCSELKLEMEKFTSRQNSQPIKVQVLHVDVVAHQLFALKLLDWMQRVVQMSEGFRTAFASVVLDNSTSSSVVERVLMEDANMWKAARTAWHHLFMSGLLMEYESKKALAKVFTKKYGTITKEYIRDDHDRHVSITCLAVQLFTVPTLAHHLIAEERAFFVLWNTFLSECARKVKDGKLVFERNASNLHFRRAIDVLSDIKFLLGVRPKEWTDELRRGFLQGLASMLELMSYMQDMDHVKRQVGQHVEYEPEWETGFLLHVKMAYIATQVVDWCGSDRIVLIKAYRMLLTALAKCYKDAPGRPVMEVHELADHSASCHSYDVSSEPVSIHLPLSRMLAGLHLSLERHGLSFDSAELQVAERPSPQQLIEHVLRLQVMIAQVHAGMWRRNGYSLITQISLYQGVKGRSEMLDRDIAILQIGAALIESNEFLILVLHKFGLLHWASANFERNPDEDGMRRTINLVEEFLGLLVTLVGERYTPGVGKVSAEDQTKKEIIQQLCIRPLSHSELYTTFPYEEMQENGIEAVINEVADFKKPANRKGVYELKENLYQEYNVFFYHYTREERSKSEEQQRRRNEARDGTDCCPPPRLPALCEGFSMLANVLQCDVMLHILGTVLARAADLRAQSFSEVQLHRALHLIGYALQEQEQDQDQQDAQQQEGLQGFVQFTERAERWRIERLLEDLQTSARVESLKGLLRWVLNKYRAVKKSRQARAGATRGAPAAESSKEAPQPAAAAGPASQSEYLAGKDKEWRAKMAAEKRAKIMAQMMAMQKSFMKENANMFACGEERGAGEAAAAAREDQDEDMDHDQAEPLTPVAIGPNQTPALPAGAAAAASAGTSSNQQPEHYICILCQEEETVSCTGPALVLAAYVQKSAVLARKCEREHEPAVKPLFLSASMGPAPHASTCGHVMHSVCWKQYYDNVLTKENRRPYRLRQPASFDIEHKEFLCPLCNCLSNTVLPLVPQLSLIAKSAGADAKDSNAFVAFKPWVLSLQKAPPGHEVEKSKGAEKLISSLSGTQATAPAPQVTCASAQTDKSPKKSEAAAAAPAVNPEPQKSREDPQPPPPHPLEEDSDSLSSDSDSEEQMGLRSAKRMQLRAVSPPSDKSIGKAKAERPSSLEISDDLAHMIWEFAKTTYEKCFRPVQDEMDERLVPIMAWQCCAYSIHSLEVLLRDEGKPLLGHMSSRQHDCLQGLVRVMALLTTAWDKPALVMHHANSLFALLVNDDPSQSCVLDWDSFGMLVPVVFLLAKHPVPSGGGYEIHALRLALLAQVVKCLLSLDLGPKDEDENMDPTHSMEVDDLETPNEETAMCDDDVNVMCDLLELLRTELSLPDAPMPNPRLLWEKVKEACRPLLRCAVLFFHFLTTVPAPPALTTPGGDTFSNMCSYLGLSGSWREFFFDNTMQALSRHWTNHPRIPLIIKYKHLPLFTSPLRINRLVTLPEDYSELMNSVSEFYCRKWVESRNPTMCLVCGEMLCSQNYCCQRELNTIQVGACTYHAAKCGAGCGIFLRVRECEVLLLALPNRGTFMTSPYVDDYGETDQGLRRGNRLRLCSELYRNLEVLWLSHGIREYVSRSIDRGLSQIIGQWHQF